MTRAGERMLCCVGLLLACSTVDDPSMRAPMPDAAVMLADSDSDWLCDETERRIGTDPDNHDSDNDRVPDGIELQYGFDPRDEAEPAFSQVVLLRAEVGAQSELQVHAVVSGAGEAFSGELESWGALEPEWPTAERYFVDAIANSAEPPDHVFGFPDNGDRIGSVVGDARLGFRLRFAFGDTTPRDCTQIVPFSYAIKRQDGARFGDRFYLLMTTPAGDDVPWCRSRSCL